MSETKTDAENPSRALHSDLARLCLPQTMQDATRKLAYANSICLLFLVIGLIGVKPPKFTQWENNSQADTVPVIFTPPEEAAPPEPPKVAEDSSLSDAPAEAPQVVTVVAASTANVAFAVPVAGPVVVASSPQFVAGPPGATAKSSSGRVVREFSAGAETGGQFPSPTYPREDLQARHEGRVMLNVVVNADGTFGEVSIQDSCGYSSLDRHALNWVKRHWHFSPGAVRYYLVPIQFQIQ
ncbi:MAG: energy transducer TonB [Verrucomicrobia bacterium]|nr:energy transducer TonB [Verrucomicrobiota bacterium]